MNANYDQALASFVAMLQSRENAHTAERFPNLEPSVFRVMEGRTYDRIVRGDKGSEYGSAYCFVLKNPTKRSKGNEVGDILMAASWKAPAKHARGNIFNENSLEGTGVYGAQYLR